MVSNLDYLVAHSNDPPRDRAAFVFTCWLFFPHRIYHMWTSAMAALKMYSSLVQIFSVQNFEYVKFPNCSSVLCCLDE